VSYRRDEMWSERYEYERLPRERLPPRPDDDPGYRWSREEHSESRPTDYRDSIRRKPIYPQYARDRSPHKRDSPYFRESPIGRRESPHSRSGSSVSSRSYSPDRSKAYTFHQSQHSRSMSSLHKRNISLQERSSTQSLKTSRDVSPSGATALSSAKTLDKSSRLSEKELAEAASRWATEKAEKVEASSVPEISEYDATSSDPLYIKHHEETGASVTDSNELFEDNHHISRSKAIAQKTKEIEQVSHTFMPKEQYIEKSSLEKKITFPEILKKWRKAI
uniref:Periphilin 1 n=1 Tax=Laticauda laticaudata TaxID=8630 RepID=A0A8C5RQS3_LATLA